MFNGTSVAKAPAFGETVNVGIHREGGLLENVAHDDARRFVPHTREAFQFFESVGNFTAETFLQFARQVEDAFAFGVEAAAGLDDFCDLLDTEFQHFAWGVCFFEKFCSDLVDADIGALGAQYDSDEQCIGAREVQRNRRMGVQAVKRFTDECDFFRFFHFGL